MGFFCLIAGGLLDEEVVKERSRSLRTTEEEEGRPRGCGAAGVDEERREKWDVSSLVADAAVDVGVPGMTSSGSDGGGRRVSEYMSSKIFESPIMAAAWSAQCVRAASNCLRALKGASLARERYPRYGLLAPRIF